MSFYDDQSGTLEWERWQLKEDPRGLVRLSLLVLLVLLVGAVLVVSLPLTAAVVLGLALVIALLPYVMPRRYMVGPEGLFIRQGFYVTRREWADFEGCQALNSGYLLPLRQDRQTRRPNLLAPAGREVFLPLPLEPEKAIFLRQTLEKYLR